ncbi:MAG TPA: hypothetical protein VMM60_14095, partial [Ilumatobacter sp.]|nr:hypothetical protein [Ilumatobacter sp.]
MSDFDVVDDSMMNRRLSDADIEALIAGAPVPGAPAPLTELLVTLRQRAAAAPSVAASGALREFIGDASSVLAPIDTANVRAAVRKRRPVPVLAKATAVLGLVPTYALIGAAAAAAAVGSAQMLGVVDVSFLPDRSHRVETPAPESEPPAPVATEPTEPTDAPAPSPAETPDRSTVSERQSDQRPGPAVPATPGPADDNNATTVECPPATTHPQGPP